MCDTLSYAAVTRAKFDALAKQLNDARHAAGETGESDVAADQCTTQLHGCKAKLTFCAEAATLQITVTDKPFRYPCGIVNGMIDDHVKAAFAQTGAAPAAG